MQHKDSMNDRDEQLIRATLEMAAETCLRMGSQWWSTYKDRHSPHAGDSRYEGMSDGADEISSTILAINPADVLAKVPPETEERCAKCGHPRSNHPYRHPFVSMGDTR